MSMQENIKKDFVLKWLHYVSFFADMKFQIHYWFEDEKIEQTSISQLTESSRLQIKYSENAYYDFDDDIDRTLDWYETLYKPELLTTVCKDASDAFYKSLKEFRNTPEDYLCGSTANKLFNNPKWIEVVSYAQKAYDLLDAYLKEGENNAAK